MALREACDGAVGDGRAAEGSVAARVWLVTEGSGGHLIPALQVALALAKRGAVTRLWYAQRRQATPLIHALLRSGGQAGVETEGVPVSATAGLLRRLVECGHLWRRAEQMMDRFAPQVVVGFGGWVSMPVLLAARARQVPCLLHEQNVMMGRANRWLARWVDGLAVSFDATQRALGTIPAVVTGLPLRGDLAGTPREVAAAQFGLAPERPTVLVVGGSQGARAINRLMSRMAALWSSDERRQWQVVHVTGPDDVVAVREGYAAYGLTAWVAPFVTDMGAAYAQADLVVARAGASTVMELAACGKPAILIPYPRARSHQRENARLIEAVGGGVMVEERDATPERLLELVRRLLADDVLRERMGSNIRGLSTVGAAERMSQMVLAYAGRRRGAEPRVLGASSNQGRPAGGSRDARASTELPSLAPPQRSWAQEAAVCPS